MNASRLKQFAQYHFSFNMLSLFFIFWGVDTIAVIRHDSSRRFFDFPAFSCLFRVIGFVATLFHTPFTALDAQ